MTQEHVPKVGIVEVSRGGSGAAVRRIHGPDELTPALRRIVRVPCAVHGRGRVVLEERAVQLRAGIDVPDGPGHRDVVLDQVHAVR